GLRALTHELRVEESVHLLGQLENPFALMKQCDCFVLSSHYEGQGMVLLEAMTLGIKVMATDIEACRSVLDNGKYGLLVEDSIAGLREGLHTMYGQGNVMPYEPFDYKEYNTRA